MTLKVVHSIVFLGLHIQIPITNQAMYQFHRWIRPQSNTHHCSAAKLYFTLPCPRVQQEVPRGHCKYRLVMFLFWVHAFNRRADPQLILSRWHRTERTLNNSCNESQTEVGLCTDRFINGFPMWSELEGSSQFCTSQQYVRYSVISVHNLKIVHFTLHPALIFRGCGFQGAQATEDQDTESKSDLTDHTWS